MELEFVTSVGISILVFCIVHSIIARRKGEKDELALFLVFGAADVLICAAILFAFYLLG